MDIEPTVVSFGVVLLISIPVLIFALFRISANRRKALPAVVESPTLPPPCPRCGALGAGKDGFSIARGLWLILSFGLLALFFQSY